MSSHKKSDTNQNQEIPSQNTIFSQPYQQDSEPMRQSVLHINNTDIIAKLKNQCFDRIQSKRRSMLTQRRMASVKEILSGTK